MTPQGYILTIASVAAGMAVYNAMKSLPFRAAVATGVAVFCVGYLLAL